MSQLSWRCLEAYWSARSGGLNQICWPRQATAINALAEDRQKALESGMDGHIAKPIDQHELTETLAKFCERAR